LSQSNVFLLFTYHLIASINWAARWWIIRTRHQLPCRNLCCFASWPRTQPSIWISLGISTLIWFIQKKLRILLLMLSKPIILNLVYYFNT